MFAILTTLINAYFSVMLSIVHHPIGAILLFGLMWCVYKLANKIPLAKK